MKKKLHVFTVYAEKGGSSQYRAYIFKEELEKKFDVRWHYFWNNTYATKYINNKKKYCIPIVLQFVVATIRRLFQFNFLVKSGDIVFIQKACIPKLKNTCLSLLKKENVRVVFDVDDAIYEKRGDNSNSIAKNVDAVICGNDTLLKHYSAYNRKCIVLPTVENTLRYRKYWSDTFDNKIIGWIGSQSSIKNLELIVDPLNIFISNHPEVKFEIICNDALDYENRIKNCRLIQWDKGRYVEDMSRITIGIMPLENTEFNKGKCGFKLIQYLNMRKPVVGSGVGVNKDIIKGNGVVAESSAEWVDALEKVMYDRKYYNECVEHIDEVFFDEYHFQTVANKLTQTLIGGE